MNALESRPRGRRRAIVVASIVAVALIAVAAAAAVSAAGFLGTAAHDRPADVPVHLAIVGDSYTAGRNNRVVWPTLLARRTGWTVSNFAQPRSGFAADGDGGQAFSYQVDRAQAANPGVVLVMSGVADGDFAGSGDIGHGVRDALSRVALAGERALVVGPIWYEDPPPESLVNAGNEIRGAATDAAVPYLDALDPPWLTVDQMQPDLSGPTDEGQSVIADKVAAWLHTQIPAESRG